MTLLYIETPNRLHGSNVAGGWAGAVMSWAGAEMTIRTLKAKVSQTDQPTQLVIGRVARDKNLYETFFGWLGQ